MRCHQTLGVLWGRAGANPVPANKGVCCSLGSWCWVRVLSSQGGVCRQLDPIWEEHHQLQLLQGKVREAGPMSQMLGEMF